MNLSEGASGGKHGKKTCNSSTSFAYKRKITLCISGAVYWICVATGGRSCVCIDFIFSAKFKCSLYSLISWVSRKRQLAVDKSARLCFHTLSSSGYDIAKKMDLTCHNAELCSLCLDIMSEVWFGSLTWWFFYSAMLDSACLMFTFFFYITFPQHQALPWLWSREQGVQRWGPPQAHHGRQRVRVHEPPDGGGRGCLQEAVLPLHQEWRHPRFGKSCLFCKPSVGRWCYDLACVLSSRRLVCLYIMWQPGPKVIFWCVFLYLPLCELIGLLAKSFKLWAISH